MFQIVNDRLAAAGRAVPFVPAHASGGRMAPDLIVVHDTAGRLEKGSSVDWFRSPGCGTSAHVVVERDGSVTQMVEFDCKAFHAGESSWRGRRYCNAFAVGIEIVNPGLLTLRGDVAQAWFHKKPVEGFALAGLVERTTPEHGRGLWMPYTPAQIEAVNAIVAALGRAYPTIADVATHWLISPRRKIDTNPLFPLDAARAALKSARGAPSGFDEGLALGSRGPSVARAQTRLKALGYGIGAADGLFGPQTQAAVLAFEAENRLATDGRLAPPEIARLFGDTAKAMPIGAREDATVADLKAAGSRDVATGQLLTRTGQGSVALGLMDTGVEAVTGFSPLDMAIDGVTKAGDVVSRLSATGITVPPKLAGLIVAALIGVALWKVGSGMTWRRLMKHRLGIDLNY